MRSLVLGAVLLAASAGTAAACVQGDRDCADAMSLDRQPHRRVLGPDAPDEAQQKYDAAKQDFGRTHAAAQATAEQEAWEKRQHPDDRPPPGVGKGQAAAKDQAVPAKKPVIALVRGRKPDGPVYVFGRNRPPAGDGETPAGSAAP